jgi:fermentation-respiration switch protein FrsA (DUF1100 family)
VAQVPYVQSADDARAIDPESWERAGEMLLQDRIQRYKTGAVNYIKVVAPEGEPYVLPGKACYDAMMSFGRTAPNWRNQVTLESLEKIREFAPISMVHLMSPAALLLMPAENDELIPLGYVEAAYARTREPKSISVLPITHFEIYREPWLSKAADEAIDWYKQYL